MKKQAAPIASRHCRFSRMAWTFDVQSQTNESAAITLLMFVEALAGAERGEDRRKPAARTLLAFGRWRGDLIQKRVGHTSSLVAAGVCLSVRRYRG